MQQAQRFAVGLTPVPTAARVTRARRALRWRVISTIISAALLVAFWYFFGQDWSRGWTITIGVAWLVSTVFWLTISTLGLSNAKKDLAAITDGVAFYLDPRGIEFAHPAQVWVPWDDISAVLLRGRNFGAGPHFVVESHGKPVAKVPVTFLDADAVVLDSAVRSYSLGRMFLDISALDNII